MPVAITLKVAVVAHDVISEGCTVIIGPADTDTVIVAREPSQPRIL